MVSILLYSLLAYAIYVADVMQLISTSAYQTLSVLGIIAVIHLVIFAVKSESFARLSVYLARRSLPIYVLHPILLSFFILLVRRGPVDTTIPVIISWWIYCSSRYLPCY